MGPTTLRPVALCSAGCPQTRRATGTVWSTSCRGRKDSIPLLPGSSGKSMATESPARNHNSRATAAANATSWGSRTRPRNRSGQGHAEETPAQPGPDHEGQKTAHLGGSGENERAQPSHRSDRRQASSTARTVTAARAVTLIPDCRHTAQQPELRAVGQDQDQDQCAHQERDDQDVVRAADTRSAGPAGWLRPARAPAADPDRTCGSAAAGCRPGSIRPRRRGPLP
jgi:hypothetical protein